MSSFLQLKDSLVFIFLLIFAISQSSSLELGASPSNLVFQGNIDDLLCNNLSIYSSMNGLKIDLKDSWSKHESKNIEDYTYLSEDFSLYLNYPDYVITDTKKVVTLCLIGKKEGKFNGLIELSSDNNMISIGVWTKVNLKSFKTYEGNLENSDSKTDKHVVNGLIFTNFLLIFSLGYFVLVYVKKNDKK